MSTKLVKFFITGKSRGGVIDLKIQSQFHCSSMKSMSHSSVTGALTNVCCVSDYLKLMGR